MENIKSILRFQLFSNQSSDKNLMLKSEEIKKLFEQFEAASAEVEGQLLCRCRQNGSKK